MTVAHRVEQMLALDRHGTKILAEVRFPLIIATHWGKLG